MTFQPTKKKTRKGDAVLTSHKKFAMEAAKRMATTKRPKMTVRTWAAHMRAVIAEAGAIGGNRE